MNYHRRHRADENQSEIIEAFERLGCSVVNLAQVGSGVPDLIVSKGGYSEFVEVKSGKAELSAAQEEFREKTRGIVHTVRTVDDVTPIVNAMRFNRRSR